MINRSAKRWIISGLAASAFAVLGWLAYGAISERRLRTGLREAASDMEAGDFVRCRERLARLSARYPGHGEILFRLGESELACGRADRAVAAWSRVPKGSPFAAVAAIRRAQLAVPAGRLFEAEKALKAALDESGPDAQEVRHLLLLILGQEGRLDEARRIVEDRWRATDPTSRDDRVALLRQHLALDLETIPLEGNLSFLQAGEPAGSGDPGLWLAQANLATRSGRPEEAHRWLDAALLQRPDDPVVWRARLEWALAAEQPARVRESLDHLGITDLAPRELVRLAAWLAARKDDKQVERAALEKLAELDPGNGAALDGLVELSLHAGQPEQARHFRERKAELDRVKDRYRQLFRENQLVKNAPEMARLALALGRTFEAQAFRALTEPAERRTAATAPEESDTAAQARLAPDHPLARFIAAELHSIDAAKAVTHGSRDSTIVFQNEATAAGLAGFLQNNGESANHQLPEASCGGAGLLDYDNDGWLDVFLVQGGPFPPPATGRSADRLFRNRHDGTFEDVTERSGLAAMPGGYSHGVAVGDYDNDGRADLFVTRWRSYALYRNRGDGTFEDATRRSGLAGDRDWPTSAAFADLDNDGDLDLYVCHYGVWDSENPRICKDPTGRVIITCDPRSIAALPDHVFRNDAGHFTDVTAEAGVTDRDGRGLGVVVADLDGDGRVDIFVANDSTANFLFRNLGQFHFEEVGQASGVAANATGGFQAGMGIACGDLDGDGLIDLAVTNFYGESTTFFHNLGQGLFADHTAAIGLAAPSRYVLGFGAAFLDADNDGRLDLFTANGHVHDLRPYFPYKMTAQLFRGGADNRLADVTAQAGPPFQQLHLGRALAVGDVDNDGRLDAVMACQNEPPVYFHNRTDPASMHFLTIRLEGTRSNRDGVGTVVEIVTDEKTQIAHRMGGSSFQSASDPRLHFGLGRAAHVQSLFVRWPSGTMDQFHDVDTDQGYIVKEGAGTLKRVDNLGRRSDRK
jgi:tetratricopeptide (TPR) repeat protein